MQTGVPEFVEELNLGTAVCSDVGRYHLEGKFSNVTFAHSKILKMWPSIASTPDDFNALEELHGILQSWAIIGFPQNLAAMASYTSLRLFVGLWQLAIDHTNAQGTNSHWGELEEVEMLYLHGWVLSMTMSAVFGPHEMAEERGINITPLRKLAPGHDACLLEMVTEALSASIETYMRQMPPDLDPPSVLLLEPQWVELGKEAEGWIESKMQQAEREHLQQQTSIELPVAGSVSVQVDVLRTILLQSAVYWSPFGKDVIQHATKDQIKRMFYFLVASGVMAVNCEQGDDEDPESLAHWSKNLLRQYFERALAEQPHHRILIDYWNLDAFRKCFNKISELILIARVRDGEGADESEGDEDKVAEDEAGHDLYLPFLTKHAKEMRMGMLYALLETTPEFTDLFNLQLSKMQMANA